MILFDIAGLSKKSSILQKEIESPEFWNDIEKANKTMSNLKQIQNKIDKFNNLKNNLEASLELNDLLIIDNDETLSKELLNSTEQLLKKIEELEIETLLSGRYDKNNAIITLHPGAGGTESQDWVEMLYRMYGKWCNKNGFDLKELDYLEGDEAGIKSVTALISGENAYGYLKGEMGVHRLIRISPFDSGGRRHTSFASVEVLPEISDDMDIYINPDDLRIDTFRASRSRWTTHK